MDIFDGCCSPSRLQQELGDIFDAAAFLQHAEAAPLGSRRQRGGRLDRVGVLSLRSREALVSQRVVLLDYTLVQVGATG